MLIGCAQRPSESGAETPLPECQADEFRGVGVGESENAALSDARSALASQISSSVSVTAERTVSQRMSNGKENLNSGYESRTVMESALSNAQDAHIVHSKRSGSKVNVVACMSRSDAAKGFAERLRPVADSLEFAAKGVIDAKHPKLKSEAWNKAKPLWGRFISLYTMIESLDKKQSAAFEPVAALYAKARDGYLDFCQTAKMHWNPEQNDAYSEIAFAKLSKNLKLEKAACKGRGISLIYKNTGHNCKYAGVFQCACQPSLLIASCYGEEYRLLESESVETYQRTEEAALEKLREKLRFETFWNEWEQEIKQWRPICE